MLQFALHPRSSVLLCCTNLTDFVLFILKCKMLFLLTNIFGSYCTWKTLCVLFSVFCFCSKMNSACSWAIRVCFCRSQAVFITLVTHAIFCKLPYILILVSGFAVFFSKRRILIFWPFLFIIVNINICNHVQMFLCIFIDYSCLVFCSFCMKKIL
jgi:hypothetical protein